MHIIDLFVEIRVENVINFIVDWLKMFPKAQDDRLICLVSSTNQRYLRSWNRIKTFKFYNQNS